MMLAAYLRGILPRQSSKFGLRSRIFEEAILEGMAAQISVENYDLTVAADAAIAVILNEESKRDVLRRIQRQTARRASLQLMDVYGLVNKLRSSNNGSGFSLVRLFQLMNKEGIFDAIAKPGTPTNEH